MGKYIKWLILPIVLTGVALLVSCAKRPRTDTDDVDGGVQHCNDTDAPKTIISTEIVSFSCQFSAYSLSFDSSPVAGRYHTFYAAEGKGRYEARGGGTVYEAFEFTPDGDFFAALQQLVAKYDLAQYNGKSYTVSGLPPDYGAKLNIRYGSGESIYASNNQSCFLSVEAMEAFTELFLSEKPKIQEQE